MAQMVTYHPGGYIPAAAQKNRAELFDGAAGTYTAWNTSGVQTSTRALTAPEAAQLAAQDTAIVQDGNQSTIRTNLQAALPTNRTFIAVATPTVTMTIAQQQQLWNQVRALSSQHQWLIRFVLSILDATN
jgi:hypothetical protein